MTASSTGDCLRGQARLTPIGARPLLSLTFVAVLAAAPHWTVQTSGSTATLRGVSAVNERVAWASGSGGTVLRTADGGATWQKLTVAGGERLDFRDVDAIDEKTAYILSISSGPASRIYKTIDAGATWTLQFTNDNPKAFYDAMTFWDEKRGIAVSDSVDGALIMITTDNGGKNWTPVPAAGLPPALPGEGAFAGSGTNIAVRGNDVWVGTSKSRVLHSRDRGRTWTAAMTPLATSETAGIFSIAFRDARHGVVVGGDYRKEREAGDNLAITSDGGATWTLIKEHGLSGFRSVVSYIPGARTSLIAVGPAGSDISVDDGRTWAPVEGPGYHTFSFAPGKKIGWGAGGRGSIGKLKM